MGGGRTSCPFCDRIREGDYTSERGSAVAFADAHPLTAGHTLVVPVRHAERLSELDSKELTDIWLLAVALCADSHGQESDACNIGINDGRAAGQTVGHVHLHIIPRRQGDTPDPRGGIRWIFPKRAAYWPYWR